MRAYKGRDIVGKIVAVELGGKSYEVAALTYRRSKEWREELSGVFDGLVRVLEGVEGVELSDLAGVGELVDVLRGTVLGAMDTVLELLRAYSPAIEADIERIEEEAFDEEILDAFVEVLKLAYPFGRLGTIVSGLETMGT